MEYLAEEFKKAKQDGSIIVKKSYITEIPTWESVLTFVYNQTSIEEYEDENKKMFQNISQDGKIVNTVHGNIVVQDPLWIKSITGKIVEDVAELKDFIVKLNKDFGVTSEFKKCLSYKKPLVGRCTCYSVWHADGLVVSLAVKHISEHKDIFDAAYIQLIGKSFWKINGNENSVIELDPGDLLLLPNELSHEVWGEGPRAGILLNKNNTINRT
jgi:hypothetical protein